MIVKKILSQDWLEWKQFRLMALQESSTHFTSTFEEEAMQSDEYFRQTLIDNTAFGVYVDEKLVASLCFYVMSGEKVRHKGVIWGLYVDPAFRGLGASKALMNNAIEYASSCVKQIHLSVVTSNTVALALYQKYGFVIYGTEPAAVFVDNHYFDEHLLCLDLLSN